MPSLASVSLAVRWGKRWPLPPRIDEWIKSFTQETVQTVLARSVCSVPAAVVTVMIVRVFRDRGEPESPSKHKETPIQMTQGVA